MKRLAEAFKGRTATYDKALLQDDPPALSAAIARNILGRQDGGDSLARYARAAAAVLAPAPLAALQSGHPAFPDPAAFHEATA